ncbi:hypothetical protein COL72_08400 [Bacillus toyonensis]|uniref:hypothetical protein n=1 Tax=Bacillus toyonensis TaxID=155322 RepID=UPI000BF7923F|nr:hypothetical protein [Bacillus toyonensis]PFZ73683.1 hypothetical protein COL72_08400 [Bacillus toyonensis]
MSHSHSHQDMSQGTQTIQEAEYEIADSTLSFAKYGLSTNGWVTPNSVLNDEYSTILRANYDYGVTRHKGFLGEENKGHVGKDHDPYKLHRDSLTWNSLDKIKAAIDNCIKEKGLLLFYDHRTGAGEGHVDEAKLRKILKYAKKRQEEGDVRVLNMNDAISSFFGLDI